MYYICKIYTAYDTFCIDSIERESLMSFLNKCLIIFYLQTGASRSTYRDITLSHSELSNFSIIFSTPFASLPCGNWFLTGMCMVRNINSCRFLCYTVVLLSIKFNRRLTARCPRLLIIFSTPSISFPCSIWSSCAVQTIYKNYIIYENQISLVESTITLSLYN